jgi:hypothetical protein
MNIYHIWCDLAPDAKDVDFADAVAAYLHHLKDEGHIHTWRLSRRKLGLGHPRLPEFHLTVEFESMAQFDDAFNLVSSRSNPVEGLHHAVNSQVSEIFFALYRDFPDEHRLRGDEMF